MKTNIIIFIFSIFLLSSCQNIFQETYYYEWELPEIVTSEKDVTELLQRPEYSYRYDIKDEWNFPHETYYNETVGMDCEDMAILGAFIYERELGAKDVYLVGLTSKLSEDKHHMIWRVGNKYYESTGNHRGEGFTKWWSYYIHKEWTFDKFMQYKKDAGRNAHNNDKIKYENN